MKTSRLILIVVSFSFRLVLLLIIPNSLFGQWSTGPNPTTNDNVGIGAAAQGSKLSIASSWGVSGCSYHGVPALQIDWQAPSIIPLCPNGISGVKPKIIRVFKSTQIGNNPMLVLDDYGNFGLGTEDPLAKLHTMGGGLFEGNQKPDLVTISNAATGVPAASSALFIKYTKSQNFNPYILRLYGENVNGAGDRFVVRNDGQVGIGVSNPFYSLSVAGGILVDNDGHFDGTITSNSEDLVLKFGGFTSGEAIGSIRTGNSPNGIDFFTAYEQRMKIRMDGAVVIGDVSAPPGYKLYVESGILTEQVKVAIKTTNDWSDFVFSPNYRLLALSEVQEYISLHHHLPDVPSAKEVVNHGVNLAEMDATLLQKIEELTLYILEQDKKIRELQAILGIK